MRVRLPDHRQDARSSFRLLAQQRQSFGLELLLELLACAERREASGSQREDIIDGVLVDDPLQIFNSVRSMP